MVVLCRSCVENLFVFVAEHLDPIYIKIAELREALESVTADQKYLKARDARHRHSETLYYIINYVSN